MQLATLLFCADATPYLGRRDFNTQPRDPKPFRCMARTAVIESGRFCCSLRKYEGYRLKVTFAKGIFRFPYGEIYFTFTILHDTLLLYVTLLAIITLCKESKVFPY